MERVGAMGKEHKTSIVSLLRCRSFLAKIIGSL